MKKSKNRVLALILALVLGLGLAVPAMAYQTPDFSDVPPAHWAYESVMKMADAGVIKGVGGDRFAPEDTLTAEMFIVLVGRVVFPDIKAEGADWSGPYVTEAKEQGLLTGTNVTDETLKGEISRYDMAVILAKCVDLLKVSATKADSSKVTDYGEVPAKYIDAVLMAYGSGLIRGDQSGSFNGANSMTRQEAATVMDRLLGLKGNGQGTTTESTASPAPSSNPEVTPSLVPEIPDEPVMITAIVRGSLYYYPTQGNGSWANDATDVTDSGIPFKILYTEDGGETSTLVAESKTTGICSYSLDFPVDKRLLNNPNGQFYISAKFEKDGQIFVTQDLRTDGRTAICPVRVFEKGHGSGGDTINLVPPTGQRWDFDLKGEVPNEAMALVATTGPNIKPDWHKISPAGFSVQLVCYPDPNIQDHAPTGERIVIGETKANEDGTFVMPVSIDTLDMITTESFRIEFSGQYNGVEYFSKDTDKLRKLSDIKHELNAARAVNLYHN